VAHTGFKGCRIGIRAFSIQGSSIIADVDFLDEEGVSHAQTRHTFPASAVPEIGEAVGNLMTLVINEIARKHFDAPGGFPSEPEKVVHGIREALAAKTPQGIDPFGSGDDPSDGQG